MALSRTTAAALLALCSIGGAGAAVVAGVALEQEAGERELVAQEAALAAISSPAPRWPFKFRSMYTNPCHLAPVCRSPKSTLKIIYLPFLIMSSQNLLQSC
jgi:hypothetical protein